MKLTILFRSMVLIVALFLALSVAIVPVLAEEHDDEMSHDTEMTHNDSSRLEQLETLLALLQQVAALLTQQAELAGVHVHTDDHDHSDQNHEGETFAVWVEIHSSMSHVHVQESGKELVTFFLENLEYTQEEEIIDAIAEKTGLLVHDIAEVIVFPSGVVDENGDSVDDESGHDDEHEDEDEHEDDSENLDGLHIMSDGTIMLGNGEELADASINDDGMVVLADGDIVEPEFDLR